QTSRGLKRVSYYSSSSVRGRGGQSFIGRVTNPSRRNLAGRAPVEYLLRQESSLADWLNDADNDTSIQVVTSKLKRGSFNCRYTAKSKDLNTLGAKALDYQDSWDKKGLPLAVSCRFVLYDPGNVQPNLSFKRDIFLAPLAG
ncbi:MAG: hypothetical protein KGJ11_03210, partial [Candidatus Omnitrophica bacterium]|nr:hypothetical protein [Candidatus Omnitrophota bacterium]